MGLFRKKSKTIDFTKMPDSRIRKPRNVQVSGGCVDLTNSTSTQENSSQVSSSSSSSFDFLNNMATSSASSNTSNYGSEENSVTQISQIAELKNKMRNFTIKIEDLSNENYKLMQKIELLERKIERLGG